MKKVKSMANLRLSDRLAPYERRVIELLRNSKDKRARKLAKKRVRFLLGPASFPLVICGQKSAFRESRIPG